MTYSEKNACNLMQLMDYGETELYGCFIDYDILDNKGLYDPRLYTPEEWRFMDLMDHIKTELGGCCLDGDTGLHDPRECQRRDVDDEFDEP